MSMYCHLQKASELHFYVIDICELMRPKLHFIKFAVKYLTATLLNNTLMC